MEDLAIINEVAFVAIWMDVKVADGTWFIHSARDSLDVGELGLAMDPFFVIPDTRG